MQKLGLISTMYQETIYHNATIISLGLPTIHHFSPPDPLLLLSSSSLTTTHATQLSSRERRTAMELKNPAARHPHPMAATAAAAGLGPPSSPDVAVTAPPPRHSAQLPHASARR